MSISEEITFIPKGKVSLAEALKEIEAVKKAFEISARLESRLNIQNDIIRDLQEKSDLYASYGFVMTKIEETKHSVTKIIKDKFEEFSTHYLSHLNDKANRSEIESAVSNRCTWSAFNTLSQNVGSLKSRLDKHVFSDFEGLKTKVKVQFGDKHSEIISENAKMKEEISQMKMRVSVVEQKIHEMFVDDGLGDSEDYDSQEENDNIMQNLNNNPDSLESESDEPKPEQVKPNITIIEARKDSLKFQEKPSIIKPEIAPVEEVKSVEQPKLVEETKLNIPIAVPLKPEHLKIEEVVNVDPPSKPLELPTTPAEILIKPPEALVKHESPAPVPVPAPIPTLESKPVPILTEPPISIPQPKPIPTEAPKISQPPKPPGSEHGSSRGNALEIPDRSSYRKRDDDASSKHKRGSSTGEPAALSRKNSMSSSVGLGGGMGAGGIRGLNKKLGLLQKDLETFKGLIDENKLSIDDLKDEFGKVYDKISIVKQRCEEIENNRQSMEQSFIKALRRSGKDKKTPAKQQVNTINSSDLKKIYNMINEKSIKLTTVEVQMEKVAMDMDIIKGNFKEKINDIIASLRGLDSFRKDTIKDSSELGSKISSIDQKIGSLFNTMNRELQTIKGPMTDLISDQQREKEILEESLKRQQATFRDIVDECSISLKSIHPETLIQSRISTARPNTYKAQDSPRISVRHKFYETNNTYRLANPNIKTDENWLASFPDGRNVALPKVGIKKSEKSLTQEIKKPENDTKKML